MRRRRLALSLLIVLALSVTAVGQAPSRLPPEDPLSVGRVREQGPRRLEGSRSCDRRRPRGETLSSRYGGATPRNSPRHPEDSLSVGSATKAFTTFVMGQLARRGSSTGTRPISGTSPIPPQGPVRVGADQRRRPRDAPVGPAAPRRALVPRDAFARGAGGPPAVARSVEGLPDRLPVLQPTYVVAGLAVEKIVETSWEEASARASSGRWNDVEQFLGPGPPKAPDFAIPSEERDGKLHRMEFRDVTIVGPALAINSCAADLVRG